MNEFSNGTEVAPSRLSCRMKKKKKTMTRMTHRLQTPPKQGISCPRPSEVEETPGGNQEKWAFERASIWLRSSLASSGGYLKLQLCPAFAKNLDRKPSRQQSNQAAGGDGDAATPDSKMAKANVGRAAASTPGGAEEIAREAPTLQRTNTEKGASSAFEEKEVTGVVPAFENRVGGEGGGEGKRRGWLLSHFLETA